MVSDCLYSTNKGLAMDEQKAYCEYHGHLILGTPGPSLEAKLQMLKDNNVKYFRDGGAPKSKYDIVMSGSIPAGDRPTDLGMLLNYIKSRAIVYSVIYKTPVYALYKDGHYGKFLGESYKDMAEFREHLAELKTLNANFVKVILSGIADFDNPGQIIGEPASADEIAEIVNICHGEGLEVMAHCNGAETIKNAIRCGVDSLEHGIFIDDEGIQMIADSGTKWIPTITAITNETIRKGHLAAVTKGAMLGANILPGSDCGCSAVPLGTGTLQEYEYLESCYIQPQSFTAFLLNR